MGLRTTILERSKAKTSSSSTTVPTSHSAHTHTLFHHSPKRQNSSSETSASSSTTTQRNSQELDPDSYEAFLQKAERDERERIEVEELEIRIKRRTESWDRERCAGGKRAIGQVNGGARAWLAQNGLTR